MQVKKIETMAAARAVMESVMWSLWAVFPSRLMSQHWHVVRPEGIREVAGRIEVNMVEFDYTTNAYKGEDWRTPTHLYMTHQCEGCHYPPDMCCETVYGEEFDMEDMPPVPHTVIELETVQ